MQFYLPNDVYQADAAVAMTFAAQQLFRQGGDVQVLYFRPQRQSLPLCRRVTYPPPVRKKLLVMALKDNLQPQDC